LHGFSVARRRRRENERISEGTLFDDADRHGDLAARSPTSVEPWWRTPAGERTSFPAVRATLDPSHRDELDDEHAAAIFRIARAAIRANAHGDPKDARRLAQAAARLCQETVGLWASPSLLRDR
jgi:hypothetical protein